ncbi:MAG: hypothetical protein COB26_07840 [Piscirickettsiaceae bacterium]|nr:MAG: hypothetical protein COB26_07840 [Piscirickettsiaceae bacterium]
MKRFFCMTTLLLTISFSTFATDKDFDTAANALCEKQKQCILNSLEGEKIPPEMEQMMTASVNNMCASMRASFDAQAAKAKKLLKPATACMKSMVTLSCEALENHPEIPECRQLETLFK